MQQEGAKLTGAIDVSGGNDETSNLHGKVDGNEISFTVPFSDATYTPEASAQSVLSEVQAFASGGELSDDATAIVLRRE